VENEGIVHEADGTYDCCLHDTPRDLDWCEENCQRYYSCDTVAAALDEMKDY
jgi:hypothetical protein